MKKIKHVNAYIIVYNEDAKKDEKTKCIAYWFNRRILTGYTNNEQFVLDGSLKNPKCLSEKKMHEIYLRKYDK